MKICTEENCEFFYVSKLFSGKWKILIIHKLSENPLRFSQLNKSIQSVNKATLSKLLKDLEADELITRTVISVNPFQVEYALTKWGEELVPILNQLEKWSSKNKIRTNNEKNL